jgi:hypothetical protein
LELRFKFYALFGITALLLLLIYFIISASQTFDIHFHDTYYIIGVRFIYMTCIILTGFLWILYRLIGRWLFSRVLLWIHMLGTILLVILFAIISISHRFIFLPVGDGLEFKLALFFVIICQLFFLINIVGGFLRKR